MRDNFFETLSNIPTDNISLDNHNFFFFELIIGMTAVSCTGLMALLVLMFLAMLVSAPLAHNLGPAIIFIITGLTIIGAISYYSYLSLINRTVTDSQFHWAKKVYVQLGMPMPQKTMTKAQLIAYAARASELYLREMKKALQLAMTNLKF